MSQLEAKSRESSGKGSARKTRAAGLIPAVVYGKHLQAPISIAVDAKAVKTAVSTTKRLNTVIDLKVGGAYRFVWRGPDGAEMGMGGVYREIVAPERLVATESFDDPWYPGEAVDTTLLVEEGGKTTATTTVLYESEEIRDAVLESGMARGVAESYDVLAEYLASIV